MHVASELVGIFLFIVYPVLILKQGCTAKVYKMNCCIPEYVLVRKELGEITLVPHHHIIEFKIIMDVACGVYALQLTHQSEA